MNRRTYPETRNPITTANLRKSDTRNYVIKLATLFPFALLIAALLWMIK
jgi:hypothetical protein